MRGGQRCDEGEQGDVVGAVVVAQDVLAARGLGDDGEAPARRRCPRSAAARRRVRAARAGRSRAPEQRVGVEVDDRQARGAGRGRARTAARGRRGSRCCSGARRGRARRRRRRREREQREQRIPSFGVSSGRRDSVGVGRSASLRRTRPRGPQWLPRLRRVSRHCPPPANSVRAELSHTSWTPPERRPHHRSPPTSSRLPPPKKRSASYPLWARQRSWMFSTVASPPMA